MRKRKGFINVLIQRRKIRFKQSKVNHGESQRDNRPQLHNTKNTEEYMLTEAYHIDIFNGRAKLKEDSIEFMVTPDLEYIELAQGIREALLRQYPLELNLNSINSASILDLSSLFTDTAQRWQAKWGNIWNVIRFTEGSSWGGILAVEDIINNNISTKISEQDRAKFDDEIREALEIS